MKKPIYMTFLLLCALLIGTRAFARTGVEIEYEPVKLIKGSELPLQLTISNFSGIPVSGVTVYYRYSGESRFRILPMKNEGFSYLASVDTRESEAGMVEYYFNIRYMDRRTERYPADAPAGKILRTAMQRLRNYGDDIVIINPEPEEQIYSSDLVIAASFTRFASLVDVEKTKLYLDTWDVSRYLVTFNDFINFTSRKVPLGRHKIRLELYDQNSELVASKEWYFNAIQSRIPETEAGDYEFSGRIYAEARREDLRDGAFINDYNHGAWQVNGRYRNLRFGGRVYLNNQEATDRQPVNRFSGFARFDFWNRRYIRMQFGDSYPDFNPLLLQNILVRGLHSTLFLKSFNIDFAYGKTLRAVEGTGYFQSDTAGGGKKTVVTRPGTYQREILAVRPSFGAGENFQLGFSYLEGRDDTSSIQFGANPAENVAAGADLFVGLDNQRIVFEGNVNASAYNRNISGGSIPYDTLDAILSGGSGGMDIDKQYYDLANKFITVNQYLVLQPALAYQAGLRLRYYKNNLSLMYESVDEEYYSLGQPYLLRDNRGFHVVDNISILSNQVFLTLGYKRYQNNLQDTKNYTTNNSNVYVNLSYFPMGNFPEITVGYNSYSRDNGLPADSIGSVINRPEDNQTNSINFTTGYRFRFKQLNNRASLNLMSYRRNDIYEYAESSSDYMALNLTTRYRIPLQTRLEFILQQTETGTGTERESTLELTTFGLGVQYTFQNIFTTDRLMLRTNARFGKLSSLYKLTSDGQTTATPTDYTRNYYSFRINYSVSDWGSLGLMADVLTYSGDRSYNDYIYSIRYDYNF